MAAQGDSTTSVLDPEATAQAPSTETAEDTTQPTDTPDSDSEASSEAPMSFTDADRSDPGDESGHADDTEATDEAEPEAEPTEPTAKAAAPAEAKAPDVTREQVLAMIRGTPATEAAPEPKAEAAPKVEAKAPAPTDAGDIEDIDADAIVKQFETEFGDDAAKAVAPLAKTVKQLAQYVTGLKQQQAQAAQHDRAMQAHRMLDTLAIDGLEKHIGNGSTTRLTGEQLKAREDLVETAAYLFKTGKAAGTTVREKENDAVRKAALLLFDHKTKAGAVAEVRSNLQQRHQSRTIKPRGSAAIPGKHKPDTSAWGNDDPETARVKAELKADGFDVE